MLNSCNRDVSVSSEQIQSFLYDLICHQESLARVVDPADALGGLVNERTLLIAGIYQVVVVVIVVFKEYDVLPHWRRIFVQECKYHGICCIDYGQILLPAEADMVDA